VRVGVIVAAILIASAGGLAPAQTGAPPDIAQGPTFRTGVNLVRVDVTVTGRNGVPLADLAPEDFDIREDGIPQPIQTFQFIQLTGETAPGDDTSLQIRSDEHAAAEAARDDIRLLVIFLDDYHMPNDPLENVRVRRMLSDFVRAEIRPTDLVAVMNPLTPMSDLKLTRSMQVILDRIQAFQGRGCCGGAILPPRSIVEEGQMRLGDLDRLRVRAEVSLSALESLVVHLGGLSEQRKSVLFVSEGPPLMVDNLSLQDRLNDVVAAANTANVTIHTLDARQLNQARFASAANGMLTSSTGGRELSQRNDFTSGLHEVMEDASAYYLIGYAPERDSADGRFHKIDVRVRQKGLRVLARKGYWAPKADELNPPMTVAAPPPEIVRALDPLSRDKEPRVAADWIGIGPVVDGHARLTVACQPVASQSTPSTVASVEVSIEPGGQSPANGVRGTVPPATVPATDRGGAWVAEAMVPSGVVTVKVALRDQANEVLDRWTRVVQVPSGSDVAARVGTPLVLRRSSPAARDAPGAPTWELERRFRHTDRVFVRLPVSIEGGSPVVTAEILNRGGQSLLRLPVAQPAGVPEVTLPLTSLAQSAYVLRFTASFGPDETTAMVPFLVVP
jgi:VWFA-related protein